MKKALITGVTGQDGSFLADILLEQGYEVHGTHRRVSVGNHQNIQHLLDNVEFHLHRADLQDPSSLTRVICEVQPDELYHMADQDNVGWSFEVPFLSSDVTAKATGVILELVRRHSRDTRVFVPCSATMFGGTPPPQNEGSRFNPQSPYAVGKVAAYYWAEYYREVHGLHVTTGIMYNHDSSRRTGDYLLHKICKAAASGQAVELGDPRQRVDIGYAREFMELVVKLVQLPDPGVYVVGTGEAPTIGDMVHHVAKSGLPLSVRWNHPDRPGAQATLQADISKLINALGDFPRVNVYGVIMGLLAHYSKVRECE